MNKEEYPYKFKTIKCCPLVLHVLNMAFSECRLTNIVIHWKKAHN